MPKSHSDKLNKLMKNDDSARSSMERIANGKMSTEDMEQLSSNKTTDQLKLFLLSQARNELKRVVKLTEFLDKLENNYMDAIDEAIDEDVLSLKEYTQCIETIIETLNRSNMIISNLLKDDNLMTIMNTTIYQSNTDGEAQQSSIVSQLKDPQSRERVRVVLQQIINQTEQPEQEIVIDNAESVNDDGDDE